MATAVRRGTVLLDSQANEGQLLRWLLIIAFCNGLARTFTRSAAYALFLSRFSAQSLPYVYVLVSATIVLTSFAYLRLSRNVALSRLMPATLALVLLALLLMRAGLELGAASVLIFVLPVLYELLLVMTNLALWNSVGRLLNVQQVKRLSGSISSGEPAAAVIGGFLTAPLVLLLGTANLLLLSALGLAVSLLAALMLVRLFAAQLARRDPRRPRDTDPRPARLPASPYVLQTLAMYSLVIISYFVIDNIFYAQTQRQFPSAAELASFIGLFNAVIALAWTLTNALVIGALLRRYGLGSILLIAPLVLALSTLAIIFAGSLGAALLVVFGLASLNKLLSKLALDGFVKVSLNLIYQPLPAHQRLQVQTLTEGVVYAAAAGASGLLLLGLSSLLRFDTAALNIILLAGILGWLAVAVFLYREYPRQLLKALSRRALGHGATLSFSDPASLAVLRSALLDPQPGVALYALQTLAESADQMLAPLLPELLRHPDAQVRQEVLALIEQRRLAEALAGVRDLLQQERNPDVRGSAARVLATLGDASDRQQVVDLLSSPDRLVQQGAVIGLLRGSASPIARERLQQWATSAEPGERLLAVRGIAGSADHECASLLAQLLHDPEQAVRRAALQVAGQLGNPAFWPELLAALAQRSSSKAAASGLIAGGSAVLPATTNAFAQGDTQLRIRIAQVWGRIGDAEAVKLLVEQLAHPQASVRSQVYAALVRSNYEPNQHEQFLIQQRLRGEVSDAAWMLAALDELSMIEDALLSRAVQSEISAAQDRVLSLLSLLADRQTIAQARASLFSAAAEQRAYALEIVDTQISAEFKPLLLPLLSDQAPAQKLKRLVGLNLQQPHERTAWLAALIDGAGGLACSWTRVCAVHVAAASGQRELLQQIRPLCDTQDQILRETAVLAVARLSTPDAVAPAGKNLHSQGIPMLSRIEKVLILKTVGIFAETPDEVLAEIADLLYEDEVAANTTIFRKGDAGTSMYIIVDGQVRVHDGAHLLNHLNARDVFGEMALLDPEPRVASVTSVVETRLLRLDQEPFYELMDERNEVARGVIRVLTRHLRARVRDLSELRTRLEVKPGG